MTYRNRPSPMELRRMYVREQKPTTAIASEIGCTFTTVCRWLREAGIERRNPSEAKRLDMARHSRDERLRITAASRTIITGRKRSHEDLCRRAVGRQRKARPSKHEAALVAALEASGITPILEYAIDKFNVDLAFPNHRLAIEVHGGNWHRNSPRKVAQDAAKRLFLEAQGWRVLRFYTRRADWVQHAVLEIMAAHHR